jgi:type VI protein secretion system component Hcp
MKTKAFRIALLACVAASPAAFAGNMSLALDGLPAVQVSGFDDGVSNVGSFTSGGGSGAGKAVFKDFSFRATQSAASPALLKHVAEGRHIATGALQVRSSDGSRLIAEWAFTDVLVSSFNVVNGDIDPKGKTGDMFLSPETAFSLAFKKVCYRVYATDGSTVANEACWNIATNSSD